MLRTKSLGQRVLKRRGQLSRGIASGLVAFVIGWLCVVGTANADNRKEIVFFLNDALGSAVAAVNESGELCWSEQYTPYGDKTVNDDVFSPPGSGCGIVGEERGYTGHTEDVNSDLVYMQQRYYDPSIGRFLSVDPLDADPNDPKGYNRYAYAFNNPYRYIDPDGRYGSDWNAETYDQYNTTDASRDIENGLRDGSGSLTGGHSESDSARANLRYWTHGLSSNGDIQFVLEAAIPLRFLSRLKKLFGVPNSASEKVLNRANHLFGPKSLEKHNLGGVLDKFSGDQVKALQSLEKATQSLANQGKIDGVFENVVKVKGVDVTVRGKVIDGTVNIGMAFIP